MWYLKYDSSSIFRRGGKMKYAVIAIVLFVTMSTAFAECPKGYTYNTAKKKCETMPTCPKGFTLHAEQDFCSKPARGGKCPDDAKYNAKEKSCEAPLACPPGTVFDQDIDKCLQK
jgi:hypothetical protein